LAKCVWLELAAKQQSGCVNRLDGMQWCYNE
jgi:hypothetical protein